MRRLARHCVGLLLKPPVVAFLVGSTLTALTVDLAMSASIHEAWLARLVLMLGILLMGFAFLWTFRVETKRRQIARGVCPSCGYDLRATPERCPECGAANMEVSVR